MLFQMRFVPRRRPGENAGNADRGEPCSREDRRRTQIEMRVRGCDIYPESIYIAV